MTTIPSPVAPAAPGAPKDSLLPVPSRPTADDGASFSDLISQFGPGRPPAAANSPKTIPTPAPAPTDATPAEAGGNADEPPATDRSGKTSAKPAAGVPDPKKSTLSIITPSQSLNLDPSLSSTLMAITAPPVKPPDVLVKPASAPVSNLTISPDDDQPAAPVPADPKSMTTAAAAAVPVAADKSPRTSTPIPSIPDMLAPAKDSNTTAHGQGAVALPPTLKPESEPVKTSPLTLTSPTPERPVNPIETPALPPQAIIAKVLTSPLTALCPAAPPSGTGVALDSQRMKFKAEKNEIAGSTVQKLPGAAASNDSAAAEIPKPVPAVSADLSDGKKDSFDTVVAMDLAVKTTPVTAGTASSLVSAPLPDTSAIQAERVAQMVSQEVVMIRQSGANALAVSLKLDPHTELFLQLTSHNGQIQASIRCERGNVAGLDSHWGNLQDSLARQNVQLLPLEHKLRTPTLIPATAAANPPSFNQSPQNPRRQVPEAPPEETGVAVVKPISASKTKTKTGPVKGWESWA